MVSKARRRHRINALTLCSALPPLESFFRPVIQAWIWSFFNYLKSIRWPQQRPIKSICHSLLVNILLVDLPLFTCIFSPVSSGGFDSSWPTSFNHSFTLQILHCNLCFSSWQIMSRSHFTFSLHSIQVKTNDSSIQHGCNLLPEAEELTSQRCTSPNPPRAKLGNYLSIMLDTSKIQASASTEFCSRKLPLDLSQV